jgi:hypothetical protein
MTGHDLGDRPGREARTALSALNLRLVLACFGLLACGGLAWVAAAFGSPAGAAVLAALALIAAVDIVVILLRRRRRGPGDYSLFE